MKEKIAPAQLAAARPSSRRSPAGVASKKKSRAKEKGRRGTPTDFSLSYGQLNINGRFQNLRTRGLFTAVSTR